jgi:Pretoxin HINT domain/A nuclease family of the HNH/ENDO VII superfamily with conserved AHH
VAATLVVLTAGTNTLEATPEHPLWVADQGWKAAGQVQTGDELWTRSGERLAVREIAHKQGQFTVYNFEVEDLHSYFVGVEGVLGHNMCKFNPDWRSSQTWDTSKNSSILRGNLGNKVNAGQDAHHVVASTHPRAQRARDLLDRYNIDINGADNGVGLLPGKHHGNGLHSYDGIDEVTRRLERAERLTGGGDWASSRIAIMEELRTIGLEIRSGGFNF